MINWVDAACKEWGRAQYWLLFGKGGFPTRTMLGKLIEEGVVGASCNQFTMTYPEVLTGENLVTANAIKTLSEVPRNVTTVHYVIRMPAKQKYPKLGMTRWAYYDALSEAHIRIANFIEAYDIARLRKIAADKKGEKCPVTSGLRMLLSA